MTDPRVVGNLKKLIAAKAPDRDIQEYLQSEGISEREAMNALRAESIAARSGVTASDGALAGTARAVGQGLTFGFGDEIEAGVKSAFGGGSYRDNVDAIRARQHQFAAAHPALNLGAELAGGLIMPGGAMKSALTAGQMVKRGAAVGSAMGAAAGAGTAESISDIPANMVQGGLGGAVMGGAAPALISGARWGAGKVADVAFRSPERAGNRAMDVVNRGLERDNVTHDQLLQRLGEAEAERIPVGVSDLAGANTLGVARGATMVPSSAKELGVQALQERAMGQPFRVAGSIVEKSGVGKQSYMDAAESLMKQREIDASPLYEAAYKNHPVIDDHEVLKLLDPDGPMAPELGQVWAAAQRIAQRDGKKLRPVFKETTVDGITTRELAAAPDLQTLDYIKRGLDAIISKSGTEGLAGLERAQIIRNKVALVDRLKEISPEYRDALQAWRGPTEAHEALEMGRMALREGHEVSTSKIKSLPKHEQDLFRLGLVSAIRDHVFRAKDGADQVRRIFGSNEMRDQIRVAFPDDKSFESFRKAMEYEARTSNSARSILFGSRTTPASQEINDLGIDPGALMEFTSTGMSPTQLPRIGAMALMRSRLADARGAVAESLGKNLFNYSPAHQRQYIEALRKRQIAAQQEAIRRGQRNVMIGAAAGRQAGLFTE